MNIWTLLLENLRRGSVTTRFPNRPPTCGGYRGLVRAELDRCKSCGMCAVVCTTGAIETSRYPDHYEWSYDPALCTFCARCVDACALKLLTMESSRPPVYSRSGELKQSYTWPRTPTAAAKLPAGPESTVLGTNTAVEEAS